MRIARIDVFAQRYAIVGGKFSMSGGKSAAQQDSTIVRVETDDGLTGWGEQCGFSPRYLAAYGEGVRSALGLIAVGGLAVTGGKALLRVLPLLWIRRIAASAFAVVAILAAVDAAGAL